MPSVTAYRSSHIRKNTIIEITEITFPFLLLLREEAQGVRRGEGEGGHQQTGWTTPSEETHTHKPL